jgi:SAM-dependent methyltransferase
MNVKHSTLLCCPLTGEELRLVTFVSHRETLLENIDFEDIDQGGFYTDSGRFYPVIDGIPRMLPLTAELFPGFYKQFDAQIKTLPLDTRYTEKSENQEFIKLYLPTLKRFGKEWDKHELEGLTWGLDQETRVEHFLHYMDLNSSQMKGKLFLDAGAGTGQLSGTLATLGGIVAGLDLSPSIGKGWRNRKVITRGHYAELLLVQGNVMQPPFRKETFDLVHSSGVLHHTPDTKQAFLSVSKLVKPGGKFGVWLYKENGPGYFPLIPFVNSKKLSLNSYTLRKYTPKLAPGLLHSLIFTYCSFHQVFFRLNNILRGKKHEQTIKERTTSIFDNLAPPYVFKHAEDEVIDWFAAEGYQQIRNTSLPDDSYGFNILGER